jgi:aromatic ring-opening dioxygenase catalytic subunit (LigB family)
MRQPTYYIPHGGGPCFFMEWDPADAWLKMAEWLRTFPKSLPEKPKALLVISAHWEAAVPTVTATATPSLIYDYGGFPPHTYQLTWPAAGAPELATRTQALLNQAGIEATQDDSRGFDHGVFIPLKVAFPKADIPTVQLSLNHSLDARQHIAIGLALQPLRDEGVLIIGSGMSYHNMRQFRWDNTPIPNADAFDTWLTQAVTRPIIAERNHLLSEWEAAAGGRDAHPREEHLIPLMVAAGAAGNDVGKLALLDHVLGAPISAYRFG